ncbi:glycoside hydrolase family 38 protein [Fistulina hepatica ATCC 64428]|uniref:Alpha-mannosidase n=1 Tax=Fistulina hepatica ATCC 64428 TaxID=1128425 RepID=A0A0D7ALN1_9AGAR|nr:glycoside hydrolase family 38 protein [Fistulina hepatica ATCC 64428]
MAARKNEYPLTNASAGSKWIKSLTQGRMGTFHGGHYADVNLSNALYTAREDRIELVSLSVWSAPDLSKPSFADAMKQKFKPASKGDKFGPSWSNHWWKVDVKLPASWDKYEVVQFEFDPGCEAMIFSTDGVPLQGITGGYGGSRRVEYILPPAARKARKHSFVIESTCNGMFGVPMSGDTIDPPDMNRYFTLASADLVVPMRSAWRLLWDYETINQIINNTPGNSTLQNDALVAVNNVINMWSVEWDPSALEGHKEKVVAKARAILEPVFLKNVDSAEVYMDSDATKPGSVWGIGNCHIDTAWLWPYSATQQKVARSWSTQVDLMERYAEYRFVASQAQQWAWLEQLYPPLFKNVSKFVLSGQFIPIGGAWVEHDANMPSGEALIRQVLFGQRFFMSRFGVKCTTAWLPDTFGLTGALPQILRGAGMKYFFTQKLSWNNINHFPHTTFNWVGIDGTQVLCHMTPVDTYTAQATVGDVKRGLEGHKAYFLQNIESSNSSLLAFGNGDGGGGPLAKMLENLRRIKAISDTHRELPPVVMGRTVDEFFEDIQTKSFEGRTLPNWHGELYLEFHRGTYTSHGSIKKGNRHSEILLRDIEHVATLASLYGITHGKDYKYPKEKLDRSWEKILLNQFLPGSAIAMAYVDAEKLYAEVAKDGQEMLHEAFGVLLPGSMSQELRPKDGTPVAYNTTFFPRREVVQIPYSGRHLSDGQQISADGKSEFAIVECQTGAAPGSFAVPRMSEQLTVYSNGSNHFVLRNSSVQMTISKGRITSLLDVQLGRELLSRGSTGGLVVFQDWPNYWDAWDVEIHHLETPRPLFFDKVDIESAGPLRASVIAQLRYGKSTISVHISLDAVPATVKPNSRSLFRFDASVDWHQRHQFLKFELPLDIHSDTATYETQFGHVARPTHKNTTWDIAKFEVCGHKFADLSEYGYGVAILSESKYGFSCLGNVLSISLLRGATAPDPEQDQGKHEFSWAVMPHKGSFLESDVPIAGYLFNSPLHLRYMTPALDASPNTTFQPPFVITGAPNVFLETIKRGEADFEAEQATSVILRFYEAFGGHAQATIEIAGHLPVIAAYETNLLEETESKLNLMGSQEQGRSIKFDFQGFQVKTIKLVLQAPAGSATSTKKDSWVTIDKFRIPLLHH